jgi:tetratricopeptide (TPR) repeat protein
MAKRFEIMPKKGQVLDTETLEEKEEKGDPALQGVAALEALPPSQQLRIARMYMARTPYKEMAKQLGEHGVKTNDAALHRFCMRYLQSYGSDNRILMKERLERLQEEAAIQILDLAIKALSQAPDLQVKSMKDFWTIAGTVGRIMQGLSQFQRSSSDLSRAVQMYRDHYKNAVKQELADNPELVTQLHIVLDKAAEKILRSQEADNAVLEIEL